MFDGLQCNISNLSQLSKAKTRSICAENRSGDKGGGGRAEVPLDDDGQPTGPAQALGRGWKVKPSDTIAAGTTLELANIEGPGCIQHIWMTSTGVYRNLILRFYWDGQEQPSVACAVGDFFASAFTSCEVFAQISSQAVCVNPGNAFNCYWPMPFRKRCRVTVSNIGDADATLYYQINYALNDVPEETAYFHAQFRRINPLPYGKIYTILDGVRGHGHYVGTYMAWGMNNCGWWGEGEIKFYIDGDIPDGKSVDKSVAEYGGDCFPTINGTGTEDYFCGSYGFVDGQAKQYKEYTTAYAGVPHIVRPDGLYQSQTRFSMYRWHITDPIRFEQDLAVTIQALGWREDGFLLLQDDIASVAYWYQTLPTAIFPELPEKKYLEII
tara:strand:- start:1782 stop:2927 length:1146 start_codon:yes stop_codon:yes gene_type:complete